MSENKRKEFDKLSRYFSLRNPVHVIFRKPPKCPKCGLELYTVSVKPHWFPYIHVDFAMFCEICGKTYAFGIPQSRDAGLSMHVFDTNPVDAVVKFGTLEVPECPWGHGKMLMTKVFGDWIPDGEKLEYQWKCPKCFLTEHRAVERDFEHLPYDPLTEEEKEVIERRLKSMGYIE